METPAGDPSCSKGSTTPSCETPSLGFPPGIASSFSGPVAPPSSASPLVISLIERFQHGSVIAKIAQKFVVCDAVLVVHAVAWLNNLLRNFFQHGGGNRCDGVSMNMTFLLSIMRRVAGLYTR